ncbi:MAG TPA: DUF1707 and DUF4190 domain-containing protein [Trebonia sp.]
MTSGQEYERYQDSVESSSGSGSDGRTRPLPAGYGPPAYGAAGFGPPGIRASSADRDRVLDLLQGAYGEGRLTKDEFDARCAQVMESKTYGELAPIAADLPGGAPVPAMSPYSAAPYSPGPHAPGLPAPYPPGGLYPPVPTSGMAIGSLACGVAELFTGGLSAIPAIILGHMARGEIRRHGYRGDGMAMTGLVLGYLGIAFWVLIIFALVAFAASGGPVGPTG